MDRLEIVHDNMAWLSQHDKTQFAMLRRVGLGASDASIYLGVNNWNTEETLIQQKLSLELTQEEIDVGEKEVVRKGSDLEPLILSKFAEFSQLEVVKPSAMYRLKEHPQLTVNFDGIVTMGDNKIPVEAKMVSMYANKYWDRNKCISNIGQGSAYVMAGSSLADHVIKQAEAYGIPQYYYPQLQQQILGLDAPFGYFAVIFDKGWEFKVYKIFADAYTQQGIITESKRVWDKIEGLR